MKLSRVFLACSAMALSIAGCSQEKNVNSAEGLVSPTLTSIDQASLDTLATTLDVKYQVLSNIETDCPDRDGKEIKHCFSAHIKFTSPEDIAVKDWHIYYSQVYPIYAGKSDTLDIEFYNGDIHQISPTEKFSGFKAGETQSIQVYMAATAVTHSQLMPNYWIAGNSLTPAVIDSTRTTINPETKLELTPWIEPYTDIPKQIKSTPEDINQYANAEWLYEHNADIEVDDSQLATTVIPTPRELTVTDADKQLDVSQGLKVSYLGLEASDVSAAFERLAKLGVEQSENGTAVNIKIDKALHTAESYELTTSDEGINVAAADLAGAFYGVQTLASLVDVDTLALPYVTINDAPKYAYRGQHMDVARNFHDKAMIFRLIEQMGAYKLNKLHMHLAEDEGWRIELPSFPELTEIGAKRCLDLSDKHCMQPQLGGGDASERDGYYSVQDYLEILNYASRHHVQVIPSLDMPGHSRVAVKAMESRYHRFMAEENEVEATKYLLSDFEDKTEYRSIQNYNDNTINVCLESSYAFVDQVLEDLIALHKQAKHPLNMYHIGADETAGAWIESPACKALVADTSNDVSDIKHLGAHFIERVSNMIVSKGISVGGWSDGLGETHAENMPKDVYSYIWGSLPGGAHKMVSEQAHRGWNVVLSVPDVFYFDFPYEVDPKERGYNWASRRIDSRNVFNFIPDNLPINAEFRLTTLGKPFEIDDTIQKDEAGKVVHQPLPQGFTVAGVQGQIWSETIRSEEQAEYMLYPRLLSLAERAWHEADWSVSYNYNGAKYNQDTGVLTDELKAQRNKKWQTFGNAIAQKELIKLDKLGVFYRVPTVGAKVIDGQLHINSSLPGLPLEYRVKGGEWQAYTAPVAVSGKVDVRARNAAGDRAGRSFSVQ
ncbi:family 20 glycosylhydrolase [Thalassotalea sp. 1_MG-2023]|uniref:family 20 glycosylhydrolase n=1 Tax=Thalassotalea sp. 1_MG-2023 TaxID=3062680 RepID=UPI0026E35B86|nr:family 20 glycosylhydrolase [Thalassotalea sp. 1_MG-2023]MDO6425540.1 family 20 glycosylhydrolase [Thalassotalea sp. 1_MG-2023]